MCAYTHVHACSGKRRVLGIYKHLFKGKEDVGRLLLLSALFLSNKIFTEPEACCLSPTGCSVSAQAMPIYLQVLDLTGHKRPCPAFPKAAVDSNSGFHACTASALPPNPHPNLLVLFFLTIILKKIHIKFLIQFQKCSRMNVNSLTKTRSL